MSADVDTQLTCKWVPSPNVEPRANGLEVDLLLLHYTATKDADYALHLLTSPDAKVSCHYLIDVDGSITQMVRECERAWHAGVSSWAGESDVNSCSIGIEIQNAGTEESLKSFPDVQMKSVIALCQDILRRHDIPSSRVLAHSDVAPARKADPGESFDWARLASEGIGLWVVAEPVATCGEVLLRPGSKGEDVLAVQKQLQAVGYKIELSGVYTEETALVVTAFQRHWRQERVDGLVDESTAGVLRKLVQKIGK